MKKFIFLFSFIFLSKDVQSQNLVNNWSFEDTLSCPSGMNSLADCAGWYQARNTPDFFHTCCSNQCEVPQNLIDYQQPRTGKAYAGFLPYTTNGTNIREVLGTELNSTLQVGTKYFVTFYVSRTANHAASSNTDIAIDKIGLQFSTVQYSFIGNPQPINNNSQVYSSTILFDTLTWMKVAGSFFADSNYRYIGISNFFHDTATTFIQYNNMPFAYYFIDDICISTDSIYCENLLSISETNHETAILYPNPASDWIMLNEDSIFSIEIFDITGKVVFKKKEIYGPQKINIENIATGIYSVRISTVKQFGFYKLLKL